MTIISNCQIIESQIKDNLTAANRNSEELNCVAVTKQRTIEEMDALYRYGHRHFGENRPEGLLEKQAVFSQSDIKWHYIGSLQTRKVKQIINKIDYLHSLDRESLAKEIDKRAEKPVACFVQVNVSGETSKHGVSPSDLEKFIEQLSVYPNVLIIGLMTMAPIEATEEELHGYFKKLKDLQEKIAEKRWAYAPCTETSMGMSGDYPYAIQEGATFIRIGSAFFSE